jgi:hypothetical protein
VLLLTQIDPGFIAFRNPTGPSAVAETTSGLREHREQHVDLARRAGGSLPPDRPVPEERVRLVARAVEDDEVIAVGLEIGSHAAAHDAETDEPDADRHGNLLRRR